MHRSRRAIGASLEVAHRHSAGDRPRQRAAQLTIDMLVRIHREVLEHAREVGDQGLDRLLLSLQAGEFLVPALHLFASAVNAAPRSCRARSRSAT